jgi:putative transcriptional regulator
MEPMKKKSDLTKLLILRELVIEEPKDQKSISESIGITPQAISEYLKKMEEEGLVDLSSRSPRATIEGVENLQRSLLRLKAFIDGTIDRLDIIRSIDAIAAGKIKAGDRVSLFLKDGLLYCRPGEEGPSTGVADDNGMEGDIVMISSLKGVVEVPEAKLIAIEIKPARQGGGALKMDPSVLDRIKEGYKLGDRSRIAVLDQEAAAIMNRSGLGFDIEMPRPPTIMDTISRGVSMICIGTPFTISRALTSQEIVSFDVEVVKVDLSLIT